jgi:hypothetical protein
MSTGSNLIIIETILPENSAFSHNIRTGRKTLRFSGEKGKYSWSSGTSPFLIAPAAGRHFPSILGAKLPVAQSQHSKGSRYYGFKIIFEMLTL